MNGGNGSLNTNLPVIDGKNWNRWMIQIHVLFDTQDILDLINDGYATVSADATEAQRNMHREMRKKDQKSLFYIHHCMDTNVYEKIVDLTTTKVVWDTLVCFYCGDASVKNVNLQSLCKKYESLNMKNNEKTPDYISRVILIINEVNSCGETLF